MPEKNPSGSRIIVIGAGAAGLMAAGRASLSGAETLLLERMKRPGIKLSISGGGRCNLTNTASVSEFISHFERNGDFLRQAFSSFSSAGLSSFFKEIGIETAIEGDGRVFPASGRAQDVVDALENWAVDSGVRIKTYSRAQKLLIREGAVRGVLASEGQAAQDENPKEVFHKADAVIIATGGASYPKTGSTGDGYRLAESAGHAIVRPRPSLVPLVTAGKTALSLQGLSLSGVRVSAYISGKKSFTDSGEMIFTHFGVSGPLILSMSGRIVDALIDKKKAVLSIDLKPEFNDKELDARLLSVMDRHGKQKYKALLGKILSEKLVSVCADMTGIPLDKACHQITAAERKRLRVWLKDFRLDVSGHRPLEEAVITAGGVNVKEVDPRSMRSKLVKNLYFAGEVLDINAGSGGYNLQAAFSTGWLAGLAAGAEE
ncbi:MAG: NAD(P)/FAD-dependent oxidoreductase [Nitrospirae bacterium]|nr:NAD(P)/FAD-dependent oxidoreductase [Nitrospirota bacterium]